MMRPPVEEVVVMLGLSLVGMELLYQVWDLFGKSHIKQTDDKKTRECPKKNRDEHGGKIYFPIIYSIDHENQPNNCTKEASGNATNIHPIIISIVGSILTI